MRKKDDYYVALLDGYECTSYNDGANSTSNIFTMVQMNELNFDIGNFDIPYIEIEAFDIWEDNDGLNNRYQKPKIYTKQSHVKYSNAEKLARKIRLNSGERINAIINGNFIFGDFIEAYFVENNIHTEKLIISTLSLSKENIDSLNNLLKGGYVDYLDIIISNYFYGHERGNLVRYMYHVLDKDNKFQLAIAFSHTKTVLFKTDGGKHIVISGSANLRSSNNIEQFTIEDNEDYYNFNLEYQKKIIDKYSTINKCLSRKQLWETIK